MQQAFNDGQREAAELEQRRAAEHQVQMLLNKALTLDAKARLTNLRLANPELASNVEALIVYLFQTKQATTIDDEQLKSILKKIQNTKRKTSIIRK